MTSDLNLWDAPREKGKPLDVLDAGEPGRRSPAWSSAGSPRSCSTARSAGSTTSYLSEKKPVAPKADPSGTSGASAAGGGVSFAPCADGTAHRVRADLLGGAGCSGRSATPSRRCPAYGGYDAHGEHSSGRAVDFMTSDSALGQAVADWARAHASELDLYDVLWAQHIWTPVRSSEGWRSMPDRGSSTANHYDHVHISVN